MFDSLKKPSENEEKLLKIHSGPVFHTIEYELSGILRKINDIDNLDEKEIKDIILRQYGMILDYDLFLTSQDTRFHAQTLFTSKKFLRCFLDVIRLLEFTEHQKICLNKLAYDYYVLDSELKDKEIVDLFYQLSSEVNGKEVTVLSGILGITGARTLAMVRNSSFKEEKCVRRVNAYIMRYPEELNLQNIVNIYCYLFHRISNLFIYTMMEAKPSYLTKFQSDRFDLISIAMLELLDSMPTADIVRVLQDYAVSIKMIRVDTTVRFALKTAKNYERIQKAIIDNGIDIP